MNNYIIIFFIFISACTLAKSNSEKMELAIYPSGGGNYGYLIKLEENNLVTYKKSIGIENRKIVLTENIHSESKEIPFNQLNDIKISLKKVEKLCQDDFPANFLLDTWIYSIELGSGKKLVLKSSSLLQETSNECLQELQNLIKLLILLSPLELNLQGFS